MIIDIKSSAAYTNSFFTEADENISSDEIRFILKNWFPVTQIFALSLPRYTALFAEEIRETSGRRRDALEKAMLIPLAICAGEYGIGMPMPGIHYRMFTRLGEPLGLTIDDLRQVARGTMPETARLVDGVEQALGDLCRGAGCIRVVEGTAYNIVEAMDKIFRPMKRADGSHLFNDHQMKYITLHLEIEKEHDTMSADLIEALCHEPSRCARVEEGIQELCVLFGDYWEAMAKTVYHTHAPRSLIPA